MSKHTSPNGRIIGTPDIDGLALEELPDSYLLSPREAAKALSVHQNTLANWRSTGRISLPYVRIGRHVRYRAGDVLRFIEAQTFNHTGEAP